MLLLLLLLLLMLLLLLLMLLRLPLRRSCPHLAPHLIILSNITIITSFPCQEARCACRQAAVTGCHNPTPS